MFVRGNVVFTWGISSNQDWSLQTQNPSPSVKMICSKAGAASPASDSPTQLVTWLGERRLLMYYQPGHMKELECWTASELFDQVGEIYIISRPTDFARGGSTKLVK